MRRLTGAGLLATTAATQAQRGVYGKMTLDW